MSAGHTQSRERSVPADLAARWPLRALDDLAATDLTSDSTHSTSNLIRRYIAEQVDALARRDVDLRDGLDVVHSARVATRRLRSVLHVFGRYLDPVHAAYLDAEMRWYAGLMGAVRDNEVLRAHLDRAVAALSEQHVVGPVAARIDSLLSAERESGRAALRDAMDSPRYLALTDELRRWRSAVPFAPHTVLPAKPAKVVKAAGAKVRRRIAEATSSDDANSALHRARKAAKRARYVAELAEPAVGGKAAKAIARSKRIQDDLGGFQDSIVAAAFLRRAAGVAESAGESTFTYGVLYERELVSADRAARRARRKYA